MFDFDSCFILVCHGLQVDGRSANFEVLDNMLQFYTKRQVRSGAWNANLEIGSNFFVPVTGYYKVSL